MLPILPSFTSDFEQEIIFSFSYHHLVFIYEFLPGMYAVHPNDAIRRFFCAIFPCDLDSC
jgi:hypothetical protein